MASTLSFSMRSNPIGFLSSSWVSKLPLLLCIHNASVVTVRMEQDIRTAVESTVISH